MKLSLCFLMALSSFLFLSCRESTVVKSEPIAKNNDTLRRIVDSIAQTAKGKVGVAVMDIETRDTFSYNGHMHLPMQSTYKFPIAITVLQKADSGQLSLKQMVHISEDEMDEDTWSPMQDKYPDGAVDIKLEDLLSYTISLSDNIGCDVLLRLIGGPDVADSHIHALGISGMSIKATEGEMHKTWDAQYTNWCEPMEMLKLIDIFYKGAALSKASSDLLMQMMKDAARGNERIKGRLPKETVVAHKSGSGGTKYGVMISATNDVGIITLPNGHHLAIVVFVSDYTSGAKNGEAVIAQIARAAYDNALGR